MSGYVFQDMNTTIWIIVYMFIDMFIGTFTGMDIMVRLFVYLYESFWYDLMMTDYYHHHNYYYTMINDKCKYFLTND